MPARFRLPVVCCALLLAAALLGGCSRAVTGRRAPRTPTPVRPADSTLTDLLIEPTRFPAQYPAAVLVRYRIDRVLHEIDGVPAGSVVTPPECAPLPSWHRSRPPSQGTDTTASSLVVTVTRPVPSLARQGDQLADCPSFTSAAGGCAATVKVTVDLCTAAAGGRRRQLRGRPDGVEVVGVGHAVADAGGAGRRRAGDGRVEQQGSSDASPDTEALDPLFTDAVLKVRRGGQS